MSDFQRLGDSTQLKAKLGVPAAPLLQSSHSSCLNCHPALAGLAQPSLPTYHPSPSPLRADSSVPLSLAQVPISVVGLIEADRLLLVSRAGVDATCGRRPHSFCDASLRLGRPTMMVSKLGTLLSNMFGAMYAVQQCLLC